MSHLYKALCKYGSRLIDDSKRYRDRECPEESAIPLRDKLYIQGGIMTVRAAIAYGCSTDDFWTENIEEVLTDGFKAGKTTRKIAYAAAEAWLEEMRTWFYCNGDHSIKGWRLKKSDRKLMNLLVEAVDQDRLEWKATQEQPR